MKLIIIDGYGFVFRAFHSLPPLTRGDGAPIGAVYGFTNMLFKFIDQHSADYIVIALDAGKKTFRSDIYPEYKAHRPPAPVELVSQFPIIREAITAFGIKTLEKEGLEADDLIASYAHYGLSKGLDVVVVSGDKDLMQIIKPGISLYDPMRNKVIGAQEVKDKFEVEPNQVLDYLSLLGDSSDNIPGVSGIGAKTASLLLNEYGSLSNIYDNIEKVSPARRQQLLRDGHDSALLSQQLVALKYDIEPEHSLEELSTPEFHDGKLLEFLNKQGFKNLAAKITKNIPAPQAVERDKKPNVILSSIDEIEALKGKIVRASLVAIFYNDKELCLEVEDQQYKIALSSGASSLFLQETGVNLQQCFKKLSDVIADSGVRKVCFDSKSFYKQMFSMEIEAANVEDISTMAYCLETGRGDYSLAAVLDFACGHDLPEDASSMLMAYNALQGRIVEDRLSSLYNSVDKPLNLILAKMEMHGVKVDTVYLADLSKQFQVKLDELSKEVYHEAGCEFNIASPKQVGEILFEKMMLPGGKRSKAGSFSTGVDTLEDLETAGFTIASKILEWRQFAKLISTYTESLPKFVSTKTGRVHTSFNATLTSTGRLSSQNPNLQNIPIRSVEGNKIRGAFVASSGSILVSADYSQIELRLLAHMADVPALKDAFSNGKDIHAITASQIFGVPLEQVDATLRRKAKAINFGIVYGLSAFGLAKGIGVSREAAKEYIESYFNKYPGIKQYIDETISFAKQHGYVNTIFGRKCLVPNINNSNFNVRNFAERAAINAPLQGSNADIIKKAMARLGVELQKYLILQIHDELLFEIPLEMEEEMVKKIKRVMEEAASISVPLVVEVRTGRSWAEAH